MLQSTVGSVSTADDVVCAKVLATPYDQSHAVMVPGATDVLPLKVQLIVLPLLINVHVSVSFGPVTPKFATAVVGLVTDRVADADAPPYDPLIVADVVPPTDRVVTRNVVDADPPGTVTVAGTLTGSLLVSVTTAPSAGAGPVSVAVPVALLPPMMLVVFTVSDARATPDVTVIVDDCVLPLSEAVIVAEPGATPLTVNPALDAPAGTVIGVCTVATAVLLLESATATPPDAAAAPSVTVPCTEPPVPTEAALSDTLAIAPFDEGPDGDFEPHAIIPRLSVKPPASKTTRSSRSIPLICCHLPKMRMPPTKATVELRAER